MISLGLLPVDSPGYAMCLNPEPVVAHRALCCTGDWRSCAGVRRDEIMEDGSLPVIRTVRVINYIALLSSRTMGSQSILVSFMLWALL